MANQSQVPPPIALLDLINGSMLTQAVYVAAELDIAEVLAAGPLPAAEIAAKVGADPDATYRLLRLLASHEIFVEGPDGRFDLTPMADCLREGAQMSLRAQARLIGGPLHWQDWGHLLDSVRTGEPAIDKLRGMGVYDFLAANPEFGGLFMAAMGNLSVLETWPLVQAYDFSRFGTIVDVFGGSGGLLAAALQRAGGAKGILVDERADMMGAPDFLRNMGVADRVTIDRTALFDPPPAGGDAYILKHILHEWSEEKALHLLKNIRGAIKDDGRLLVMEYVVPQDAEPHAAKLVDLWLMLLIGGRERTEAQYRELLAEAGFEVTEVVGTMAPISIVEARPV